jgi:hypothetical protein
MNNKIGPHTSEQAKATKQQQFDYFNKMAFELGFDESTANDVSDNRTEQYYNLKC